MNKRFAQTASKKNITLFSRNTSISKSFAQTEETIQQLSKRKLEKSTTSYINGTPASVDEALSQGFEEADAELLQKLAQEIDTRAASKTSKVIKTQQELIGELTPGDNHVLMIIARSDNRYIHF